MGPHNYLTRHEKPGDPARWRSKDKAQRVHMSGVFINSIGISNGMCWDRLAKRTGQERC